MVKAENNTFSDFQNCEEYLWLRLGIPGSDAPIIKTRLLEIEHQDMEKVVSMEPGIR